MIPNVFISSTIADLHHLRDAIRDVIIEIGYTPIMSDHGDIGYLPTNSAEESCYIALQDCQLAIFIIGKRYGSIGSGGKSVTHNEFQIAQKKHIPVVFLIDQEVLNIQKIYDANSDNHLSIPGMDSPSQTFGLIKEFSASNVNNGYQSYTDVNSARSHLKNQLAHYVGNMLRRNDPGIRTDLAEVLAEIKTLRQSLPSENRQEQLQLLRATKYLLIESRDDLLPIVNSLCDGIEKAIPIMLRSETIDMLVEEIGGKVKLVENDAQFVKSVYDDKTENANSILFHREGLAMTNTAS